MDLTTRFDRRLESLVATIQGAVAEGDQKRLDEAKATGAEARKLLVDLKALGFEPNAAGKLEKSFEDHLTAALDAAQIMLGTTQGDTGAAIQRMQGALSRLQAALGETRKLARAAFDDSLQTAGDGVNRTVWVTIAIGVAVVGTLFVGSFLVIGSVWRQLGGEPEYARSVMHAMAAGDLSQDISVAPGATGSLLAAVQEMAQGLRGIVGNVRQGTETITTASQEIAMGNHDLSQRTERQAGSLEQTASNIRSLAEAVRQSAEAARQANQLAGSAAEVARRGGEVVTRWSAPWTRHQQQQRGASPTSSAPSTASPSRPTSWPSTPRWRRRAPASRGADLRWWPARCARWRSAAPRRPRRSRA
jgi:methyl-accepting chemotaxis protein